MKSCLLSFVLFACLSLNAPAQKLKRADRVTLSNIQAHLSKLRDGQAGGASGGGSTSYVIRQFERDGLQPRGSNNSWLQPFEIDEGKTIQPGTCLVINGDSLRLFSDYTVAAFSANDEVSTIVSAALAEKGVPWFKDFREVTEGNKNPGAERLGELIRKKAAHAAEQGASALLIYNTPLSDALFKKMDSSQTLSIPILLIGDSAGRRYLSDESALLDLHLKVDLGHKRTSGVNLIGYADHAADSIVVTAAHLSDEAGTAALLELARLTGRLKSKNNYLFIVYSGEENDEAGKAYYQAHPCVDPQKVRLRLHLDGAGDEMKALGMVKDGINRIQQNK